MGHTQSTMNTANAVSDIFFSSLVRTNQTCRSSGNVGNTINVSVKGDPALMRACLKKNSAAQCAALQSRGSLAGLSQTNNVQISTKCKLDASTTASLQADITNAITQKAQTDKSFADVMSVFTGDKATNSVSTSAAVKTVFNTSTCQKIVNNVIAKQKQSYKVTGGGQLAVAGVQQNIQVAAFVDALMASKTVQEAVARIETDTSQTAKVDATAVAVSSAVVCSVLISVAGLLIYMKFVRKKKP